MDQVSVFISQEELAYKCIKPAFDSVLNKYLIGSDCITCRKASGYYSILYRGNTVIARLGGVKKKYISVPAGALSQTDHYKEEASQADHNGYAKIPLNSFSDAQNYVSLLQEVLQVIIERSGKEFDCCSRYLECSDARQCIHPDPQFGLKCGYRLVLKEGKVYYGKNRNIV